MITNLIRIIILIACLAASPILAQTQNFEVDSTHTFSDGRTVKYLHDGKTAESFKEDSGTQTPKQLQNIPLYPKSQALGLGLALGGTVLPVWWAFRAAEDWHSVSTLEKTLIVTSVLIGPSLGQFYAGAPGPACLGILGRFIGGITINPFIYLIGTIYSLADTPIEIQRHNEKVKAQHFGFSPELFPSSNGGLKPGVMAWAKF